MPEIQLKRGTDAARTDGTLGTPDSGTPIYATDTKALFVGDGTTDGAVPATVPATLLALQNSLSQNINALSSDNLVEWNVQSPAWGVDLTHSTVTDKHKVTIDTTGVYEISASLALDATGSTPTRYNGIMRIRLNGSASIGPEGKGGYIRETGGQDETSLHITPFPYAFTAADYIWLKVDRESSTTAAVDTTARASVLYIKRLK
tara:strand:- start:12070 stop:12681 length:612 start_codon:yes stop_codon:yes gene_type:complete